MGLCLSRLGGEVIFPRGLASTLVVATSPDSSVTVASAAFFRTDSMPFLAADFDEWVSDWAMVSPFEACRTKWYWPFAVFLRTTFLLPNRCQRHRVCASHEHEAAVIPIGPDPHGRATGGTFGLRGGSDADTTRGPGVSLYVEKH